ncbi:MAG: lamin tail domain-containing protein [Verrucomicrobiales bacterium]|nr:lamin tail domain-containing protein [Verrucomicrobiales bacterium]
MPNLLIVTRALLIGAVLSMVGLPFAATADPRINEFMASNKSTLVDEDGDRSDWIEIYNPGTTAINLRGWHLTDQSMNLVQWQFPDVTLQPDRYLLVFASGKNRNVPGQPLHTNFSLNEEGEYLALVRPDGSSVVQSFDPFPTQRDDISYGVKVNTTDVVLLAEGAPATALIPVNGTLGTLWTATSFNDSQWLSGTTGIGYDYGAQIGLDVCAMRDSNSTVYARVPFTVVNPAEYEFYTLRLKYEDGVIAYLNGTQIFADNLPNPVDWQSAAPNNRPDSIAQQFYEIDITPVRNLLNPGTNVLAFHGLNNGVGSSDLLISPEVVGRTYPAGSPDSEYFVLSSPREANGEGFVEIAGDVLISSTGRTFTGSIQVELTETTPVVGTEIRYTLNGDEPHSGSPLYTGTITLSNSTYLRARVFEPAKGPGLIAGEAFVKLESDIVDFSSNLPIIVIDNFGRGGFQGDPQKESVISFFEPVDGRTSPTNDPTITTRSGIKRRGSSTGGQPKPNLAVEAWDEYNRDVDISPFGMPSEADWVLYAPLNIDPSLMNNPLMYELGNHLGRYAVRTRFVEVFINTDGGNLELGDYHGIYVFMEKIDREGDRVDIDRLLPEQTLEPDVSGGYILKIDRADPGDSGFNAANQSVKYVYPGEEDILQPERDAQEQFIRGYVSDFGSALYGSEFTDPVNGYAPWFDVEAAIDHHLLNVLSFNVDGLRLSTFMHKPRNGKITFGPIWDFDRALSSNDGRDDNPWVWRNGGGTDFFNYGWWNRLFSDIDFFQKYIDRWQELRRSTFSTNHIFSIIDGYVAEVNEAQPREQARWGITPRGGSYAGEIALKKQWLTNRIAFMESQFVPPPKMSSSGGQVSPGFELQLTGGSSGSIYYTLDGSDPRLPGGTVSPTASLYTGSITIQTTSEVRARIFDASHTSWNGANNPPLTSQWSGIMGARLTVLPPADSNSLAVTEINYHPAPPSAQELLSNPSLDEDDFEFLELRNISDETIDLVGAKFTDGITFEFTTSSTTTLVPGGRLLLVKDLAAFQLRYGSSIPIDGQYSGSLKNSGELIRMEDRFGIELLFFEFEDGWYRLSDGLGFSLQVRFEDGLGNPLGDSFSWRASAVPHGSPGAVDGLPIFDGPIVVNEVLAHTDLPQVDSVELKNLSDSPVDISHWWLTDDLGQYRKYQFPAGTVLGASGFLLVDESDFNANPQSETSFLLSSLGDEVWIVSADSNGDLTGYLHGLDFGANKNGVSLGRFVNSAGKERLVRQSARTLSGPNSSVATGPVIISELMYYPPDLGGNSNERDEFVEVRNLSGLPVQLYDPDHDTNVWKISNGVEFTFPRFTTIPANGHILLVSFDPVSDAVSLAAFRSAYGLTGSEIILGPFEGKLKDAGERVTLRRPDTPQQAPAENPGFVPMIEADSLRYSDGSFWSTGANGSGMSLQRLSGTDYADEPLNWIATAPTPASFNGYNSIDRDFDGLPTLWEMRWGLNPNVNTGDDGAQGDPDHDGKTNLEEWRANTNPNDNSDSLRLTLLMAEDGSYQVKFQTSSGRRNLLQSTADLVNWKTIEQVPAGERRIKVEVFGQTFTPSFFRVISQQD